MKPMLATLAEFLTKLQKPKQRPPLYVVLGRRVVMHRRLTKVDGKIIAKQDVPVTITRVMPRRLAEQMERDRQRGRYSAKNHGPYSRKRECARRLRQMGQLAQAAE